MLAEYRGLIQAGATAGVPERNQLAASLQYAALLKLQAPPRTP